DNSDVIATDTQKNTVHVLAKQHGVKNIETFALILSEHFLRKYPHVQPVVMAGIRNLRVLKTTESAFRQFVTDEFRTLPDTDDRVMSTVVTADWWYNTAMGFCFDKAEIVKSTILEKFAGPPETGMFSASVQNTLYISGKAAIARIPQ
ncbi:URIC-like protein, partial [Mya arenaria]